jgi:hypothetical protein
MVCGTTVVNIEVAHNVAHLNQLSGNKEQKPYYLNASTITGCSRYLMIYMLFGDLIAPFANHYSFAVCEKRFKNSVKTLVIWPPHLVTYWHSIRGQETKCFIRTFTA